MRHGFPIQSSAALGKIGERLRLPRGLDTAEARDLPGSFRTLRDRTIAGLMIFSGLRSAEVLKR